MKVRSMAWDVWIHACLHRFIGSGYDFEGSHGCIAMVFCLIMHGDGCLWRLGFSLNEGFLGYILCHNFCGYIVYSLQFEFKLYIYFRSIMGYVET